LSRYLNNFIILLCFSAISYGCGGGSTTWYKEGGTQREFDIDSRECEQIATSQALEKSDRGDRYDPGIYSEYYNRCLTVLKGWGTTPLTQAAQPPSTEKLFLVTENTIKGFGLDISVPTEFTPINRSDKQLGPTAMDSLLWGSPSGTYINIIFQLGKGKAWFQTTDYLLPSGYSLYSINDKSSGSLTSRWSYFFGKADNQFIKGAGAYLFVDKKKRCIIVVTSTMAAPTEEPPDGLSLSENQYVEMEDFIKTWDPWIEELLPEETVLQKFSPRKILNNLKPF